MRKGLMALLLAFVVMVGGLFAACGDKKCKDGEHKYEDGYCIYCGAEEPVEKKLMRIGITSQPDKTEYIVGEEFDATGMVVTAYYNDSSNQVITDYTVENGGPFTRDDKSVTISYQGKTATISISVRAPLNISNALDIETAESKVYTIEAEDLDFTYCVNSNNTDQPPVIETVSQEFPETSGGKSVGALSVPGNKFGFNVNSTVSGKITVVMRASATHINIPVDDFMEATWNDTVVKSNKTLSWSEGRWFGWEHAYYSDIDLKEGQNQFLITITGMNAPNIDCFYVIVNPTGEEVLPATIDDKQPEEPSAADITITDSVPGLYKVEAESLDYSACTWSNGMTSLCTEANTDGGTNVVALSVPGNKFGFTVNNTSGQELDVTLQVRASANNADMALDELVKITLNGQQVKTGATLSWSGTWNECNTAVSGGVVLTSGENIVEVEILSNNCPNFDYFAIEVGTSEPVEPSEPDDPVEPDEPADITISDASANEYKVEAESLDYSACTWSNGLTTLCTEPNTDGGTNVVALATAGNKFGFTAENTANEDIIVSFKLRASANGGDMALDNLLKITWNGEEIKTGATLSWSGTWNECGTVTKSGLTLKSGINVVEIEVLGDLCPNFDYFAIEVGAAEPDDPVEPDEPADITISDASANEYKIEAESLDYSACIWSNGLTTLCTESNTDGGTNVVALATAGNKFGFTVENATAEEITVTFKLRASANGSDMALDNLLKITWNGEEIKTGATLSWSGAWNECNTATKDGLVLQTGKNIIEIEVLTDACPNLDFFVIEVA